MNLPFIYPWFLAGLVATVIPIIIHLIYRRRFRPVKWAAMKFLLAAYKRNKTSLLLEHLLLLFLRILLIILLVLLFARPVARAFLNDTGLDARATRHYIIVVDNSYSMGVRDGNSAPFEKAKREIRALLKQAQSKDSFTLVTMNDSPKVIYSFKTIASESERGEIRQKIDELSLSYLGTNVTETVNVLYQQTEKEEYRNKFVYIITDCQKKPWLEAGKDQSFINTLGKIGSKVVAMYLLDVGISSDPDNLAVVDLAADGVIGVDIQNRFVATVHNFGTRNAENVVVDFFVDGNKQDPEYISVPAGEQQQVAFFYTFVGTGSHTITVKLGPDKLEVDNQRHLALSVVDSIKVLVIDGDPKEGAFESEIDFLMAAIGGEENNLIQAKAISIGDFVPHMQFKDYDVVILANLQTFDDGKRFEELDEFVRKGGGVLLYLGNKVDPDYYNREFFRDFLGLLPGKIDGSAIGRAEEDIREDEDKTSFSFSEIDFNHPAFSYFKENKRLQEDLYKCLTYKFFPIDKESLEGELKEQDDPRSKNKSISILARYDDPGQHPAILERIHQDGKVLLVTTTADRAWNSFTSDQFGHVFLIMVHEFIQYLVTRSHDEHNLQVEIPIVKKFSYYAGREAQMTPPEGSPMAVGIQGDKPPYKIEYIEVKVPGIYQLRLDIPQQMLEEQPEAQSTHFFAVNVDPQEGDINRASQKELDSRFQSTKLRYVTAMAKEKNEEALETTEDQEYWKHVLLLLLVFCGLETFLAMWFGRYQK